MDVLWLLAESIPPDQIADLVNEWVREDRLGGDSSAIFSGLLATWGGRILPALEQFAVRHLSTEDVWTLGSDVAKGIAGAGSATVLQPLMTRLITSDDLSVQRVGLTIVATVPLPDQIERIWALHRIYGVRRVEMEKFDGALEDFRYKISLDALVNVAGANPDWVERKIRATQNEDDLVKLVYLMMKLKRGIGAELWGKTKECLFARLPAGRRCLSQAIGHFRDESCIDWLSCVDANGHEPLAIETRFGALVRPAPNKALEFLKMMSTEGQFRSTKGGWLRPLIQKLGEPAQLELRRFFDDGKWTGVRNLAILFQGDEDLVDDETLTLIIDTFEARLEANDHVEDWQPTGERDFLRLLSNIRSPRLLRLLETKRGSRFEELLTRRAIRRGGRKSLHIESDICEYRSLLLKIGGEGIAEVIANDLSCESHWARSDALKRVQWSPTPKLRSQVLRLAQNDHHEKIEEVHLMQALASLEEDAAFAEMLRKGTPAYLNALKIRRSKSPIPKAVRDQACADALSADENAQHSGITILSLCKGREVTRCLQRVLESNGSDSRAAHEAVWALDQIGHCSDQILPLVTRMINHQDSQLVVFNYLLHHGGPEGEAIIADYLANHNRAEITIEDQVAQILVSRGEQTGSAASFLWDIVKKRKSFFDSNTSLSAFSEMGDRLADDLLFENAIAERCFSGSPAVAIEAIASQDPEYAFEAAARLLERDAEAGGEEILLSVDAKRAICSILRLLEQDIGALSRWRIYRHLRWLAPHSQLAAKLREMAKDDSPRKRELACEILGWLPPEILVSCLEACANDIERNVEQAAIEALKKRQEQRDVEELLSEMATADGPARWSRLYAILDLFDPHTLARREDPLCIWPVLDRFPYDFTMEAETILKQHVDREKQKAGRADRCRRNH
jgi:HEAT repeats